MSIDHLLDDLHADRMLTINEQLLALERDLAERRLASAEQVTTLFEQVNALTQQILNLQPENDFCADPHRMLRSGLEREQRTIQRELQLALRERWRDISALRRETRALAREQRDELHRYERHTGNYDT